MWHRNLCIKGEIRRNIREKGSKDDSICEIGVKSQIHLLLHFPYCVGVVFSHSHVWLFATPWTAACQTFLSFTVSHSLLKLMSIESVIPSNHLILCTLFLPLPSMFPSIKVFFQWNLGAYRIYSSTFNGLTCLPILVSFLIWIKFAICRMVPDHQT